MSSGAGLYHVLYSVFGDTPRWIPGDTDGPPVASVRQSFLRRSATSAVSSVPRTK